MDQPNCWILLVPNDIGTWILSNVLQSELPQIKLNLPQTCKEQMLSFAENNADRCKV